MKKKKFLLEPQLAKLARNWTPKKMLRVAEKLESWAAQLKASVLKIAPKELLPKPDPNDWKN